MHFASGMAWHRYWYVTLPDLMNMNVKSSQPSDRARTAHGQ